MLRRQVRRLLVTGRVQGVGFRPFVARTAMALGLDGWVRNDGDGVTIVVAGLPSVIDRFVRVVRETVPEPGRVDGVAELALPPVPEPGFRIRASEVTATVTQECAPDFAPCADCVAELLGDGRRAGYPFIACSACGPRHAITRALPFDRTRTTMDAFVMCPDCAREYGDPRDRRYHAQLISCPACGPSLRLADMTGVAVAARGAALDACVAALHDGAIVAVKGIGGFLLVCDATRADVVERLRARKQRPTKPFACLMPDLAHVARHCRLRRDEAALLASAAAPIVLLAIEPTTSLPVAGLAPGLDSLGVMLPASPLLLLLARAMARPLVATSANVSGSPTLHREEDVLGLLGGVADLCLADDRPLLVPQDDSVVRITPTTRTRIVLRRGRGLAPAPVDPSLLAAGAPVMALGAHMKASFTLGGDGIAYHSQYLGDLESAESEAAFARSLAHARTLAQAAPRIAVSDAHGGYATTHLALRLARAEGLEHRTVWHHRAHLLALLAEHQRAGAPEPVLGLVWDGTGLGEDGTLWGGEFLLSEGGAIARVAHLAPVPMPFGDRMAREPRLAVAAHGAHAPRLDDAAASMFSDDDWRRAITARRLVAAQASRWTSSMGRLFDAASALLGLGTHASYEGCGALRLEALAHRHRPGVHEPPAPPPPRRADGVINGSALLLQLLDDLAMGHTPARAAWRFHDALAGLAWDVAAWRGVRTVGATGGCWQNALLVDRLLARAPAGGRVLLHRDLPPNDENIAFGQFVAVALDAQRPLAVPPSPATVLP
jgi:hydrogenase maturation protein HypF